MKLDFTAVAFIEQDGKLLLIKRTKEPWRGLWHFLGGHVDEGETPQDALVREISEEAGIDIELEEEDYGEFSVLATPLLVTRYPVGDHAHTTFVFKAAAKNTEVIQNPEWAHEGEIRWVKPDEVEVSPLVKHVLKLR